MSSIESSDRLSPSIRAYFGPVELEPGDYLIGLVLSNPYFADMLSSLFPKESTPRTVLIHYHIFKNAGTSVDRLLAESFGRRWHQFESDSPSSILKPDAVDAYARKHPKLVALSSHTARPPLPQPHPTALADSTSLLDPPPTPERTYYPIVLLRHPIVRIRSMQRFLARDANQRQHPYAKPGLRHYVEWLLERKAGMQGVGRNFQVAYLSDASFRKPKLPTQADLEQAKQVLAAWPAFGLVNEFSRSMALFNHQYGPQFPELKLYNRRDNVTSTAIATEDEALSAIERELGANLYENICEANQLDLELFTFASQRFTNLLEECQLVPAAETTHGS